jgi:hypothetical protein
MLYPGLLQDFIRQVCKPAYTNCFRDRDGMMGVVEFETADDMDRTIRWVAGVAGWQEAWLMSGAQQSIARQLDAAVAGNRLFFSTAACALHFFLCVCMPDSLHGIICGAGSLMTPSSATPSTALTFGWWRTAREAAVAAAAAAEVSQASSCSSVQLQSEQRTCVSARHAASWRM